MKRIATLITVLLIASISAFAKSNKKAQILSKTNGSITFVVDENLPAVESRKPIRFDGNQLAQVLMEYEYGIPRKSANIVATSFADEQFTNFSKDIFFRSFVRAYAEHKPLVLSPDMVWLSICQAFGHHVNSNPEMLRNLLVDFEAKQTLTVETDSDMLKTDADWLSVIDGFSTQIAQNTKGDIAQTLRADFSTTTQAEHIASGITLMDAVKPYFNYHVMRLACGIPSITLTGTPKDWQTILDKTQRLSDYGLDWWIADLRPILKQFVEAANGRPNQEFWKNIVMQNRPDRLRGGACSSEEPTNLDGWFLKLFPFTNKGRTPDAIPHTTEMPTEMVKVPFVYLVVDQSRTQTLSQQDMELWAGFIGVYEDSITHVLTPKIGWLVRKANTPEEEELFNNMKQPGMESLPNKDSRPTVKVEKIWSLQKQ